MILSLLAMLASGIIAVNGYSGPQGDVVSIVYRAYTSVPTSICLDGTRITVLRSPDSGSYPGTAIIAEIDRLSPGEARGRVEVRLSEANLTTSLIWLTRDGDLLEVQTVLKADGANLTPGAERELRMLLRALPGVEHVGIYSRGPGTLYVTIMITVDPWIQHALYAPGGVRYIYVEAYNDGSLNATLELPSQAAAQRLLAALSGMFSAQLEGVMNVVLNQLEGLWRSICLESMFYSVTIEVSLRDGVSGPDKVVDTLVRALLQNHLISEDADIRVDNRDISSRFFVPRWAADATENLPIYVEPGPGMLIAMIVITMATVAVLAARHSSGGGWRRG